MSKTSMERLALIALAAMVAVDSLGCKSKAQKAKEVAEATPVVESFRQKLRAIQASLPSSFEESSCEDAAVQAALGPKAPSIGPMRIDTEFFSELEGTGPRRNFLSGIRGVDFLVSTHMQLLHARVRDDVAGAADAIAHARQNGGDIIIVFQVRKNVEPKAIVPETAIETLLDKKSYAGGDFDAWAIVYALEGPKRLCQAHVQATSSETVKVRKGKLDQALYDDYRAQIEHATQAALKRISPRLRATF